MFFLTIFISFILFSGCDSNKTYLFPADNSISENTDEESDEYFDSFEKVDLCENDTEGQVEDETSDNDTILDEVHVSDESEIHDDDIFTMPDECVSHYDCSLGYDENNYCRGSDCVNDSTFVWKIAVTLKQKFTMECVLNKGCDLVVKCNSDEKWIPAPKYSGDLSVEVFCSNPSYVYVAMHAVESAGTGGMMVLHDTVYVFKPDPETLTQKKFVMYHEYGVFAYTLEFTLQE
ncbi:MAG TPA: hypothetical protein VLJ60_02085 [bacterium]|nr:hypothetical protein [bacterium]